MNRYERIPLLRTTKGKRYRRSVKYPEIPRSSDDIYIIGSITDRLDNLAYSYYDDARLWWIIARANNIGKGDLTVPVGLQLRIPQNVDEIVRQYNELNE